ncbi:MAG: hypothetical protein HWD61_11130 [Parachlamydiaceae bacterium]|nr:MAG: hypothetical protein HWD61_11130 [Parachlamydiaceae bacterium]
MQKLVPAASAIVPRTQSVFTGTGSHGNKFVFLSALPKLTLEEYEGVKDNDVKYKQHFDLMYNPERIALIFSNKVLANRDDYHYSLGTPFGKKLINNLSVLTN